MPLSTATKDSAYLKLLVECIMQQVKTELYGNFTYILNELTFREHKIQLKQEF